MGKTASAGNYGKGIRSDCFVSIELTNNTGINIELESKVKVLYGNSIITQVKEILNFFEVNDANVKIIDSGALPSIISARIEAAVKQLIKTDKEYLPEFIPENNYSTKKDDHRFSRLYLPGNTPSLMINAGIHKPNGIILDLEDSVAPDKKYEARFVVRNVLRNLNFYGAERMVRINQLPTGIEDLKYIIPHNVNLILVPKCEEAEQIKTIEKEITKLKKQYNIKTDIWLMPIIESAKGVINAYSIASASPNIVAMAIGLEDYTADIGVRRTNEATESFFARTQIVNVCHSLGIQPIDSVFSDIDDMNALKEAVLKSKTLGFVGMGCIHPRQIEVINQYFAPNDEEIEKAIKIVNAFYEAKEKGLGVVALGSKMIDAPVVKRALKVIDLAINIGKLSNNWREEIHEK